MFIKFILCQLGDRTFVSNLFGLALKDVFTHKLLPLSFDLMKCVWDGKAAGKDPKTRVRLIVWSNDVMSEASVSAGSCYQTPGPLAAHESSRAVGKRETCWSVTCLPFTRGHNARGYAVQVLHRGDSRSVSVQIYLLRVAGFFIMDSVCFLWMKRYKFFSLLSPESKAKRTEADALLDVFREKMWHLEICIVEASGAVGVFFSLFIYIFLVIIVSDPDVD